MNLDWKTDIVSLTILSVMCPETLCLESYLMNIKWDDMMVIRDRYQQGREYGELWQ